MTWLIGIFQGFWKSAEVAHLLQWLVELCRKATKRRSEAESARPSTDSGGVIVGGRRSLILAEGNIAYGCDTLVRGGDGSQIAALRNITSRYGIEDDRSPQFPRPDGRYSRLSNSELSVELHAVAATLSNNMETEEFASWLAKFRETAFALSAEATYRLKGVTFPSDDFGPMVGYGILLHGRCVGAFQAWSVGNFLRLLSRDICALPDADAA